MFQKITLKQQKFLSPIQSWSANFQNNCSPIQSWSGQIWLQSWSSPVRAHLCYLDAEMSSVSSVFIPRGYLRSNAQNQQPFHHLPFMLCFAFFWRETLSLIRDVVVSATSVWCFFQQFCWPFLTFFTESLAIFEKINQATLSAVACDGHLQSVNTGWPKKMRTHILFDKKPIF